MSLRGIHGRQTLVVGAAYDRDAFDPKDVPQFAYRYSVPGAFAQDDVAFARWLTISASARLDVHNEFGTFLSPRLSALFRGGGWQSRVSIGSGFFAPTALTEETEAAGLTRLRIPEPLKVERGQSASLDVTRSVGGVTLTGTLFHYDVHDPAVVDRAAYTLNTLGAPTTSSGVEAVGTWRGNEKVPIGVTGTYTYVRSLEGVGGDRGEVPLTPRHSAGLIGMWENGDMGRIGIECYVTGAQRLEDNPYAVRSAPYVLFGGLVERRFGNLRVFVNAENLGNVRQTNWDPLLRPSQAADGRWTVDAWAPLDGRVINGGVRIAF
jgi:iron complex outermembrane receptor protein